MVHNGSRRRSRGCWAWPSPNLWRTHLCSISNIYPSNPVRQSRPGYASVLAGLPEELRRAYRDGDFSVGIRDADFQVIPTAWVLAAEARWKPDGGKGLSMTDWTLPRVRVMPSSWPGRKRTKLLLSA